MIKWCITGIMVVAATIASAQDLADTGYIVLTKGDTLFGEVQFVRETFSGIAFLKKIRYWNANGKRKKYSRTKLAGFRVGDAVYRKYRIAPAKSFSLVTNYYQIVPYGGEVRFLRVMKEGNLSHFEYEWVDGQDNYISSFPLLKRADEMTLVRATQGIFGIKKKVLSSYFYDCPSLQTQIQEGKFKLPFEIVNYYNTRCGTGN